MVSSDSLSLQSYSNVHHGENSERLAAELCKAAESWLESGPPQLALVFAGARLKGQLEGLLGDIMTGVQPAHLVGCSGYGVVGVGEEFEDEPRVSVLFLRHPRLKIQIRRISESRIQESTGPGFWQMETDIGPQEAKGILLFADPFSVTIEKLAGELGRAYPGIPLVGGLASGTFQQRKTLLFHSTEVLEEGALAVFLDGPISMETVVSQWCKPIGEPLVITRAEKNVIYEIGGKPAAAALRDVLTALEPEEQEMVRGNIFIGLAVDEYKEDFGRGDFLVRNMLGVESDSGGLIIGAGIRTGQTLQFQLRHAAAAREDMFELLQRVKERIGNREVKAGLMCSCNGRGKGLFGKPGHDPKAVSQILGKFNLTGFFCNGEIGPIGEKVFVHGYTCALGLFLDAEDGKGK
jgi:small ligand-binding sensory domain FIST